MVDDGLISEEKIPFEVFCENIMIKRELGQDGMIVAVLGTECFCPLPTPHLPIHMLKP